MVGVRGECKGLGAMGQQKNILQFSAEGLPVDIFGNRKCLSSWDEQR